LANLCEEQGRYEEAKEFRRGVAAIESTLEVHSDGNVLRKKSTITFGDEGLPLSELSNVAAACGGILASRNYQAEGRTERTVPMAGAARSSRNAAGPHPRSDSTNHHRR